MSLLWSLTFRCAFFLLLYHSSELSSTQYLCALCAFALKKKRRDAKNAENYISLAGINPNSKNIPPKQKAPPLQSKSQRRGVKNNCNRPDSLQCHLCSDETVSHLFCIGLAVSRFCRNKPCALVKWRKYKDVKYFGAKEYEIHHNFIESEPQIAFKEPLYTRFIHQQKLGKPYLLPMVSNSLFAFVYYCEKEMKTQEHSAGKL